MEVRIQKWGNSFGIRIPSSILKSLDIKDNDLLTIEEKDEKIVITKSKKNKISLVKRFNEYKGEDLTGSFSWDKPVGKEIW